MTNRHEELSDSARWFLENFDEIDLADLCASKEATIGRVRDREEATSVRAERAEAELRRVRDTNQQLITERVDAEDGITAAIRRAKHEEQRALRAEAAIARVHQALDDADLAGLDRDEAVDGIRDALDEPSTPAATQATEHKEQQDAPVDRKTAAVSAALHHSAEADVSRVIDLYERWTKAGAPPIGTSVSRWWDTRLAELATAIQPATEQQRAEWTPPPPGNTREQLPAEKCVTRRPCRYCPDPLCPESCPECGGPIHDLDAVPAQHHRGVHPDTEEPS